MMSLLQTILEITYYPIRLPFSHTLLTHPFTFPANTGHIALQISILNIASQIPTPGKNCKYRLLRQYQKSKIYEAPLFITQDRYDLLGRTLSGNLLATESYHIATIIKCTFMYTNNSKLNEVHSLDPCNFF